MATIKGFHAKLLAEQYKQIMKNKGYAFLSRESIMLI